MREHEPSYSTAEACGRKREKERERRDKKRKETQRALAKAIL